MEAQKHTRISRDRVIWTIMPLVEEYSRETTIAIYLRNPPSCYYKLGNKICEILRSKGFTRAYVLYLFSKIGTNEKIFTLPNSELINSRCNEVIKEIIPDVGSIVLAYGDAASEHVQNITEQRVIEVIRLIKECLPSASVFRFGDLTNLNNPKSIDQLQLGDELIQLK